MLSNSPGSPENLNIPRITLNDLSEVDESDSTPEISPTPALDVVAPAKSLAEELGVADSDEDESPLREKTTSNVNSKPARGELKATSKDKGKARADHVVTSKTRLSTAAGVVEKENKVKRSKKGVESSHVKLAAAAMKKSTKSQTQSSATTVAPPPRIISSKVKGGARRVPIDSAEAAPLGPAWKG